MLDGPIPVAPPYCLLNVPGVLRENDGNRWINGASVWAYPVDEPLTWDPCSSGTFRTKAEGGSNPLPVFGSFVVYLPITCSSAYIGDPDSFRDRGRAALEAVESYAVESALSQGAPLSTNPFFGDAAVTLLAAGAAVTPEVGLSYLEDAIGETGRMGMIHCTPSVASQWFDQDRFDSPLTTANGTPVAAGGGYIGAQPTGGAAPSAGQSWAFATGPVEVRHAEAEVMRISEVLDRSNNDVTYRAERYVLATWDTALQAAVLIDWTP